MVHEEVVEDQELIASDIHLVSLETKSSHKQALDFQLELRTVPKKQYQGSQFQILAYNQNNVIDADTIFSLTKMSDI